jgi:hypothetical protein
MKEIFFLNGIRAGKTEVAESFRRYGTVAFSTKVMAATISTKDGLKIDDWLELVPPEFMETVAEIISSITAKSIAENSLEKMKFAYIREIQNKLEEKIKSGRCLISTLPDLGCPN